MTRKPKGTYPNSSGGGTPANSAPALRRRAEAYRDKADQLEAMLNDTQKQFAGAFAAADSQLSTRERITDAARGPRRLGARGTR